MNIRILSAAVILLKVASKGTEKTTLVFTTLGANTSLSQKKRDLKSYQTLGWQCEAFTVNIHKSISGLSSCHTLTGFLTT